MYRAFAFFVTAHQNGFSLNYICRNIAVSVFRYTLAISAAADARNSDMLPVIFPMRSSNPVTD